MIIYLISLIPEFVMMYAAPFGYDYFPYLNGFYLFMLLFFAGIYATSLAMFINAVSSPKVGITLSIICVVLYLAAFLMYSMLGNEFLYDRSIIPTWVRVII